MILQLTALFTAIVSVLSVSHNPSQPSLTLREGVNANTPLRVRGDRGVTTITPPLTAPYSFLVDTASGTVLQAQNADQPVPIASITKLMTAVVLREQGLPWERRVTLQARDKRNGDIPYLLVGEEVSVREAWNIMLVSSSNDATMLLVRTLYDENPALSDATRLGFVELMNKKAAALGLRKTHFTDPTGLDPGNVATAREVAVLARYALAFPEIRSALLQRKFVFAPTGSEWREVLATNQLLYWFRLPGVKIFGGKTGRIEESGYNLVFASGRGEQELVGVVLGSADNNARFEDMSRLMSWGFNAIPKAQSPGD